MSTRLPLPVQAVFVLIFVVGVGLLGATIAGRIGFAWPLEWMEGASMQHASRILEGKPLYPAPGAEFIPFVYPPLAYLPMAASLALLGHSLPAARVASLLALLLSLVLLGRGAARVTGVGSAGLLAAGLYALGFGYTGGFLDLARVDAIFMLLVIAGVERAAADRSRAALACFALSCFAKQHGVIFLLAASWHVLATQRRAQARAVGVAWLFVLLGFALMHVASAGFSTRYLLVVPAGHGIVWPLLFSYFAVDLGVYLPVLSGLAALGFARSLRQARMLDLLLLAGVVASALGRAHPGGDDNVRLPGYALVVVCSVAALVPLLQATERKGRALLLCAVLLLQAGMLVQSPRAHWPRPDAAPAFARLRSELVACARGGSAVALDHAGLADTPFLHTMALSDLRACHDRELSRRATDALLRSLASDAAPAAVGLSSSFPALDRALAAHYQVCVALPSPLMATGYQPGVQRIFRRR